jgi:hypothetical protein
MATCNGTDDYVPQFDMGRDLCRRVVVNEGSSNTPIVGVDLLNGLRKRCSCKILEGIADIFVGEYCNLRMKEGFRCSIF